MRDTLDVISQTTTYLNSTFTCAAAWSHGGGGTDAIQAAKAAATARELAAKKATDAGTLAKLKSAKKKLGLAATVASATYGTVTNPPVWEGSAKEAWTTGGDEFMQCLANAVPDYVTTNKQLN